MYEIITTRVTVDFTLSNNYAIPGNTLPMITTNRLKDRF